jgi:Uma2 family endonuclease
VQNVLLTQDSAPEPDIAIVRGVPRDYMNRHQAAGDVALIIEVADSSLDRDRLKARIYARAGVPVFWIVNLIENQIEVYSEVIGSGRSSAYQREEVFQAKLQFQ